MTAGALSISRPRSSPALFAPAIDMIVAGGGLSVILLLFVLLNHYTSSPMWMTSVIFWGGIVVNNPHYAATYYRVYRSTSEMKKYAWAAIIAPLALIALGGACILSPDTIAPWYCKAYIVGSGFHYSGQSYGIALIYARKAGVQISALQKLCIGLPIFMSYFYTQMHNDVAGSVTTKFFNVTLPNLPVPGTAMLPLLLILLVGIELYVFFNLFLWWKHKQLLPFIVHLITVSHCAWFLVWGYQPFAEMVPFFHCFQYVLITSYFYMQELVKKGSYSGAKGVAYLKSHQFLRYYVILIAVGYSLFFIVPKMLSWAGICTFALANAIVFSFINLHHFVLDGEIWKLRRPEIGKPLIG